MAPHTLLTTLRNIYIKIETSVLIILLNALVGLVFMEVIVRFFDNPTTWSVGIAQLIFMWVIFLGANRALRNHSHIGIDVFTNLLPSTWQKYVQLAVHLVMLVFLAILIVYGFEMTFANTGRLITGTSLGYFTVTLAIPVGAILMLGTAISQMGLLIKNLK
ncbi:TRAP transporter small permease [Salibacterium aidingense]|uniref:TRAP transporter small permease n=1 Tax=Salibacterium aidingense TaxID=384933 RepID=UPI003BD45220